MRTILLLISAVVLSAFSDPRYRTFSKLDDNGNPIPETRGGCPTNPDRNKINFRPAHGYERGSDYINVGSIDGNPYSPLSQFSSVGDVALRFSFLVEYEKDISTGPNWLDLYTIYVGHLDPPIPTGLRSKQQVLAKIMENECGTVDANGVCGNYVQMANDFISDHGSQSEIVFEIGNEPNVFPYLSAELYAWYYKSVRARLMKLKALPQFSQNSIKTMPAGLWIMEGMPEFIQNRVLYSPISHEAVSKALTGFFSNDDRGIRFPNQTTAAYYTEFLSSLTALAKIDDPALTAADLIDKGNLHFYPYTYAYSAFKSLQEHLDNLKALTEFVAESSKDHEVWLTEFGNINPLNDPVTKLHVNDLTAGLEQISAVTNHGAGWPGLTRWYYFISVGDDTKFESLPNLAPELALIKETLSQRCIEPISDDPDAWLGKLICLLRDFKNQPVVQGLIDARASTPDDDRLRPVGQLYIRKSTGLPCGNSSAHAPYLPSEPSPTIGADIGNNDNQPQVVSFRWKGGDPDGDPVTASIQYLLPNGLWVPIGATTTDNFRNILINPNTTVNWRVVVTDGSAVITGPAWQFNTNGGGIAGPSTPTPVFPTDNEVVNPGSNPVIVAIILSDNPHNLDLTYKATLIDVTASAIVTQPPSNPKAPAFLFPYQLNKQYLWQAEVSDAAGNRVKGPFWQFFTGVPTNRVLILTQQNILKSSYLKIEDAIDAVQSGEKIRVLPGTYIISRTAEINPPVLPNGNDVPNYDKSSGPQGVLMTFDPGVTINFDPAQDIGIYLNATGRMLLGQGVTINPSIELVDAYKKAEAFDPVRGIFSSIGRAAQVSQPRQSILLDKGIYPTNSFKLVDESLLGVQGNSRDNSTIIQLGVPTTLPVTFSNSEGILFSNLQFEVNFPNLQKDDPILRFLNRNAADPANSEYRNCVFVNTSSIPRNGKMLEIQYFTGVLKFTNCLFKNFNKGIDVITPTDVVNAPSFDGNIFNGNEIGATCPAGGACFKAAANNDFWNNGCDLQVGSDCFSGQARVSTIAQSSNKFLGPMFVDENNLNFRLTPTASPGSPLIDAKSYGYTDIGPFQLSTIITLTEFIDATITTDKKDTIQIVNGVVAKNTMGQSAMLNKRAGLNVRPLYDVVFEKNMSKNAFNISISQNPFATPPLLDMNYPVVSIYFNNYLSKKIPFQLLPEDGTKYKFSFRPDNTHPKQMQQFRVNLSVAGNSLSWSSKVDKDVERFKIYKNKKSKFPLEGENQIATLSRSVSTFIDSGENGKLNYVIVAYDSSGNQSDPVSISSVGTDVHPFLERIVDNCDGTFTAYFGYSNPNAFPVTIPLGSENKVVASGLNGNQKPPTIFQAGKHASAFNLNFRCGIIAWSLNGLKAGGDSKDAINSCNPKKSLIPRLEKVIKKCGDGYVAYFGYDNPNPKISTILIGIRNGFCYKGQQRLNLGQPTQFEKGKIRNSFSVKFDGSTLVWKLTTNEVSASKSKAPAKCVP